VKCSHEGLFGPVPWETTRELLRSRRANPGWGWQAESSWLATPFLQEPDLFCLTVVHLVRRPKAVINSHLRLTRYADAGRYYQWAQEHFHSLQGDWSPEDAAARFYITLNEACEERADIRHRIEDPDTLFLEKLGIEWQEGIFTDKRFNARPGRGPSNVQLGDFSPEIHDRLLDMTQRYGYPIEEWTTVTVDAWWVDGLRVPVSERAAEMGGSWQFRGEDGAPMANDVALLQFFADKVRKVRDPVIVDVGASAGSFSILPRVTGGQVVAFEPNPDAYKALVETVRANGLENSVRTFELAVGEASGEAVLRVPADPHHAAVAALGNPRYRGFDWRDVPVRVVALDDLAWDRIDFLKIDTEGAELLVLRGAERTIRTFRPKILIEYQSLNTRQFGYEQEAIQEHLVGLGYRMFQPVGNEDLWCEP